MSYTVTNKVLRLEWFKNNLSRNLNLCKMENGVNCWR